MMCAILTLLAEVEGKDVAPWAQTGVVAVCTGLLVWLITKHLPKRDKEASEERQASEKAAREERQKLLDGAKSDRDEFRIALHDVAVTLGGQMERDNAANRATTTALTNEFHQLRITLQGTEHVGTGPRGDRPSDKA